MQDQPPIAQGISLAVTVGAFSDSNECKSEVEK